MARVPRPTVALPLIAGAAVVVSLLMVGNLGAVCSLLRAFRPGYLLASLLVLVGYEAIQCLQWRVLLRTLGIGVPRRIQACAFFLGQPVRALPAGNFAQNGLLSRATGTDFALSSAATTVSVLLEVAVALLGLAVLGMGPWGWVRPLIVVGLAAFALSAWAVYRFQRGRFLPARLTAQRRLRAALAAADQFRAGVVALSRPAALAWAGACSVLYLMLGGSLLYLMLRGLGVTSVSWWQVLAVYFFSLASALILPLPMDIGVTELGGIGALLALGVGKSAAVSAVLLVRGFSLGGGLVIALIAAAVLHTEARALLGPRRESVAAIGALSVMPSRRTAA